MGFEFENEEKAAEVTPQHEEEGPRFSTSPIYTFILLGCIAVVFVAQYLTSTDPQFFVVDRVSAIDAGFDKQAFLKGEYWRLLTGTLIHSGILHAGMNSYALYSFGRLIEILSNRAHVAIVFVLAALGGDFLSLAFNPDSISVGASGGIVGFLSYLAVYAFKRREFISREFRKSLLVNIGFILVFGFVLFGIVDNYGHIGGLIVGAAYGMVQIPRDEYTDPRVASSFTKLVGVVCLCLYIVTAIITVLLLMSGASRLANA